MTRILIDGFWYSKPRGLGRYMREVVHALAAHAPDDCEIVVAVPAGEEGGTRDAGRVTFRTFPAAPYPVWEQFTIPRAARAVRADVVHCPYNTVPFARGTTPYVVTIHDLIFEHSLGMGWYQKLGNLYRRCAISSMRLRTPRLVTVSESSARLITERIGVAPAVMYTPTESVGLEEAAAQRRPATPRTVLHIGGISPHKNSERVILAFLSLRLPDTRLVVLGMGGDSDLAGRYRGDAVVFPGWVDDAAIARYYAAASLLVFPSLTEGYGLPIVEGFTAGVPVLTTAYPPMSEVAGDAALLVDPLSTEAIAEGMKSVLTDASLAASLVQKGRRRLESINSRTLCRSLVEVYRSARTGA